MSLVLTIGATDALDYLEPGGLEWESAIHARHVLRARLKDFDATYRPALRQEVIAELAGGRFFLGIVQRVSETDMGGYLGRLMTVEAAGYEIVVERLAFNGILNGPTLRDALDELVAARFGAYGITRKAAMPAGPTIGPQGFDLRFCSDVLNGLATIASGVSGVPWRWRISAFKEIEFYEANSRPGPIALTATNETIETIETDEDDTDYANHIIVHYGPSGTQAYTDTLHGDGSTRLFPLTNTVVTPPPTAKINGATVPVGVWGTDTGLKLYYRASDQSLIHDFGEPVLTALDTIEATYLAQYPGFVARIDPAAIAAVGEVGDIVRATDIVDRVNAEQLGDGVLAQRLAGDAKQIRITTQRVGYEAGQSVPVDVSERAIDADCLITSARLQHVTNGPDGTEYYRFALELVEGDTNRRDWRDYFRETVSSGGGGGISASGSAGAPGGSLREPELHAYLGGSRAIAAYRGSGDPVWRAIPEFVDAVVDEVKTPRGYLGIQSKTTDPACSVTPRIVSVDAAGEADEIIVTGTAITSLDWEYQSLPITFADRRPYRVEFTTSQLDTEVYLANAVFEN